MAKDLREELLDIAQTLLMTKGYAQLSVNDVLLAANASKGAFYHHFASKQDLLEEIVDRLSGDLTAQLATVTGEAGTAPLDRINDFFAALAAWKVERRELLVAIVSVWQSDGNALARQKLRQRVADRVAPILAGIIRDGVAAAAFQVTHPEATGRAVVSLVQDLNDRMAQLFLAFQAGHGDLRSLDEEVAAYTEAVERTLGAAPTSVSLVDMTVLRDWFTATKP